MHDDRFGVGQLPSCTNCSMAAMDALFSYSDRSLLFGNLSRHFIFLDIPVLTYAREH